MDSKCCIVLNIERRVLQKQTYFPLFELPHPETRDVSWHGYLHRLRVKCVVDVHFISEGRPIEVPRGRVSTSGKPRTSYIAHIRALPLRDVAAHNGSTEGKTGFLRHLFTFLRAERVFPKAMSDIPGREDDIPY